MSAMSWTIYESPLGPLTLVGGAAGLAGLRFPGRGAALGEAERDGDPLVEATRQLDEYFLGVRRGFELDLDLGGTLFQRTVWDQLRRLPYGTTVGYTELADLVGRPDRVRAVAAAVGRTPVPIVIPCHRVVAADGSLTGYLGGLRRKAALLSLERQVAAGSSPEPAWAFRQLAMQL